MKRILLTLTMASLCGAPLCEAAVQPCMISLGWTRAIYRAAKKVKPVKVTPSTPARPSYSAPSHDSWSGAASRAGRGYTRQQQREAERERQREQERQMRYYQQEYPYYPSY